MTQFLEVTPQLSSSVSLYPNKTQQNTLTFTQKLGQTDFFVLFRFIIKNVLCKAAVIIMTKNNLLCYLVILKKKK